MSQLNSSISNSSTARLRVFWRTSRVAVWAFIGLVIIDVAINVFLAYPSDPKIISPPWARLYFEYGRSIEGQLRRMTRPDPSQTAPITLAGWYDPLEIHQHPSTAQGPIVTIYGMSHAMRLGFAMRRISDRFTVRLVGAPGAPANWSYGAYLRDRGGGKSRAVVLSFMSATLAMTNTLSAMTWSYDLPMPYTSDRFYLDGQDLDVVHPPYESFQQYVKTFYDPVKWSAALKIFAKYDTMYSPVMMDANIFDHSSLLRLVRRAYGYRLTRNARRAVLDESGFHPNSEQVLVARAMIHDFAKQARSDGMIPVIFLVNNLGFSDYLFQALSPALKADNVPYVSSHQIVSPSDPRGYLPDSHFTDQVDDKLAAALIKLLNANGVM